MITRNDMDCVPTCQDVFVDDNVKKSCRSCYLLFIMVFDNPIKYYFYIQVFQSIQIKIQKYFYINHSHRILRMIIMFFLQLSLLRMPRKIGVRQNKNEENETLNKERKEKKHRRVSWLWTMTFTLFLNSIDSDENIFHIACTTFVI